MGALARWTALLLAASIPPALAWPHDVTIDHAKLPPCPRPGYYLRAVEFSRRAAAEIKVAHLQSANRLLDQGLAVLGTHYDPYVRLLDDTGQHLSLARMLEANGKLAEAVQEKRSMLESRLHNQVDPGLCNKVVTRTAW